MHFIFVYFVRGGFSTKIKFTPKAQSKAENPQWSAAVRKLHAYERSEVPNIRKFSAYEIFRIYSTIQSHTKISVLFLAKAVVNDKTPSRSFLSRLFTAENGKRQQETISAFAGLQSAMETLPQARELAIWRNFIAYYSAHLWAQKCALKCKNFFPLFGISGTNMRV